MKPHEKSFARPFLKWAGGKGQLLGKLKARIPEDYGRYYEPFIGGGALFFDQAPLNALLGDINPRLVRAYRGLKDDVEQVIFLLGQHAERHSKEYFYEVRKLAVDESEDALVAAWLIYLNRTAFNGLYRVNKKGGFNVPIGSYKNPRICEPERLRRAARVLQGVTLKVGDFEALVASAEAGDFVYFDPPYIPLNETSNFTSYAKGGFDDEAHIRLRDLARALKARGVSVLLSNSWTPRTLELYKEGFEVESISARRAISAKGAARGEVKEALIS